MRPKNTPNDPDRRERIVDAAIQLIQASGIAGVTARSVATQARVPVGSVTYYFDSVRALLIEASRCVLRMRAETLGEWLHDARPETVATRLAELTHHYLTEQRPLSVVVYELYILGIRDKEFRAVSRSSVTDLRNRLTGLLPPAAASHLAAAADGYQIHCLFEEKTPSVEQIRRVLLAGG